MSDLLELKGVNVSDPNGRILTEDLNGQLSEKEVLLIKGKNGSGKTTLLRTILGMWPFFSGTIELRPDATEVDYLPQIHAPEVHLPLSLFDLLSISLPSLKVDKESVLSHHLLEEKHLSLSWNTASGGEKKRTLLTQIFMKEPKVLFLDEPFNHLDAESHQIIGQSLKCFVEGGGAAVIVSHEDSISEFFQGSHLQRISL